ncbi:MAG: ABC transporter substrate-binding protein [Alphaproteobacteria bacterium]
MHSLNYWKTTVAAAGMTLALGVGAASAESVLRVAPHADLKNTDPIWTTAYITRNHGYLVYDNLFAVDDKGVPQPQMVSDYSVSDDGLEYTFTLRDGLAWHNGSPVTAEDCVASLQRWSKRDGMGQKLFDFVDKLEAVDAKTFKMTLKEKYGLVLQSIGKISSNTPFMMSKEHAATDAFTQVTEVMGSGPFKFVKDEWVPGSKVVYVKNPDYKPREGTPNSASGARIAKVDRVEWIYIPDAQTTLNALANGEIDYWEAPSPDMMAQLESTEGVKVELIDPLGAQGWLRLNHTLPPFNNVKARQAILNAVNQEDYLRVIVGDPKFYKVCPSYFICGSPNATTAGSEGIEQNFDKAKALLKEAGYNGEKIVMMQPTDIPVLNSATIVTAEILRKVGMNVDIQAMDWSTLTSRRALKEPLSNGGWNIFHTYATGADAQSPVANIGISGGCEEKAWFGWPCDPKIEQLRDDYAREPDPAKQKAIVEELQKQIYKTVPNILYGQFFQPVAYSSKLSGVLVSPVPFFWNIEKQG